MNKTGAKTKKDRNDTVGKWRNGRRKKISVKTKRGDILQEKEGIVRDV